MFYITAVWAAEARLTDALSALRQDPETAGKLTKTIVKVEEALHQLADDTAAAIARPESPEQAPGFDGDTRFSGH